MAGPDVRAALEPQLSLTPGQEEPSTRDRGRGRVPLRTRPLHVLAAFMSAAAIFWSPGPLNDFDSLWHVELGRQMVQAHRLTHLDAWWLAVPQPHDWVSSQWLAEVLMYLLTAAGGWHAVVAARVVALVVLIALLWRHLLQGREPYLAVPVFLLTLQVVAGDVQDRPQTAGLIFLAWLGPAAARLLFTGNRPPVALVAACCLVWAQLHGTWILAPAAFMLVAACLLLDPQTRTAARIRPALVCAAASLTGLLNPHGAASFLLPFRFSAASTTISEWRPTTITAGFTIVWALLIAVTALAWARTPGRTRAGAVVWVLCWTAFGLQSYRNVAPAGLLIAPATLQALEDWYSSRRRPAGVATGRREALVLTAACGVLLAGSVVAALVRVPGVDVLAKVRGLRSAQWVAAQPGPVRVFNTWNAAGALIGLSDRKARLVVDGRNDLWGAAYILRLDAAEHLQPGWQRTVSQFHPDAAVLERHSPLVSGLTMQGWRVAVKDGDYVLLTPH